MTTKNTPPKGKILKGRIVSAKMSKTVVVAVSRYVKHPKYKKYLTRTKRYLAHDDPPAGGRKRREGDEVEIRETRPRSRHKSFEVI